MNNYGELTIHNVLNTYAFRSVPVKNVLNQATEGYDNVVIFNDFNNICSGMYYPEFTETVLNFIINNNNQIPSIIVNEFLRYEKYLEQWALEKNKKLRCIYHSETGKSFYHINLFKEYKSQRHTSSVPLPLNIMNYFNNDMNNINEVMAGFRASSWDWIKRICNRCNIATFRLNNLDSDFIPEFLFRKCENFFNDETCYIIISTDGDMIQLLDFGKNVKIISSNKIIDENNWLKSKSYLREMELPDDLFIRPDRIILYKSTVGDSSDGIKAIPNLGKKAFAKDLIKIDEDIDCDDLNELRKYFNSHSFNKTCKKIIDKWDLFEKCIKLTSFKQLIDYLYYIPERNASMNKLLEENKNALEDSAGLLAISENNTPVNFVGLNNY